MTHLGADLLMGYARRTLDAEALLLADDHLSGCRECRGRLIDDDGLTATVRSLARDLAAARHAPTGHLPYDQIEARAEGRLRGAAREVAETHLDHCAPCTVQTRDLEGFATAFRDARPRATVAGAAAAAAENDAAPGAASGTAGPGAAPDATAAPAADPSEPGVPRSTAAGAPRPPHATRPAMRVSDEALAEDAAARPATRGGAFVFSAARDGEEKSRAGTVALVIVGAAILVAVGYGGRASWQRLTALKGRVQELERRNESLQAQAGDSAAPAAAPDGTTASGAATGAAAVVPSGAGADGPAGAAGEPAEAPGAAPAEAEADAAAPLAARRALTIQDKKGPVGLDAEGDLVGFDGLPVAAGKVLAAALRRGGVDVPDEIRTLAAPRTAPAAADVGPEPTAAGAQEIAMTLATAAGTIVRSTRPVLSWGAVEGAKAYRVAVFDAAGTVIVRGGPMRGSTWTVSRALQRGAVYEWRVVALRAAEAGAAAVNAANPGPTETAAAPASDTGSAAVAEIAAAAPAPAAPRGPVMERFASGAARFKVLGQDEATALERVLRAAPGSRLVAGVMAARAGLLDDAERDLRALAAENSDSGVARGLLASVEAARLP